MMQTGPEARMASRKKATAKKAAPARTSAPGKALLAADPADEKPSVKQPSKTHSFRSAKR
jgi:DNA-binding IclR family transcriptional regulator